MSSSFVVKSLALGGGAIFIPSSSYLAWDYFSSLYEIEKKALVFGNKLTISGSTEPTLAIAEVKFTDTADANKTWTCKIIGIGPTQENATVSNKSEIIEKIKQKLPVSESASQDNADSSEKLANIKNLLKNCSRNRNEGSNDGVVSAKVFVPLRQDNKKQWRFEEKDVGSLFSRGFWI